MGNEVIELNEISREALKTAGAVEVEDIYKNKYILIQGFLFKIREVDIG